MKIAIASDHGGFKLKEELILYLKSLGYQVVNLGTDSEVSVDYPDYGFKVGEAIRDKNVDMGIVICKSGIGISIAANKVKGVRCAKVSSIEDAEHSRIDNNANCIALAGDTPLEDARNWVQKFIMTSFSSEERHHRRVDKVDHYGEY